MAKDEGYGPDEVWGLITAAFFETEVTSFFSNCPSAALEQSLTDCDASILIQCLLT